MKAFIHKIMRKQGFDIQRFQRSPYEELKEIPRYNEMVVELFGDNFKIADSLSFYWNFREIFLEEIYKFKSVRKKPFIIDCGSNYGTSIVYFKSLYPEAKIIGVEPDPRIFRLLQSNIECRNYQNVSIINKAVSTNNTPVQFYCEGADGGRVFPLEDTRETVNVKTIQIDDLISKPVDFLKIDIEGSETEVICSSEKLQDVSNLFVEYHSFEESKQTLSKILDKLTSSGFRYYIHTQFCSPRPLMEERLQLGMDLQLNLFAKRIT